MVFEFGFKAVLQYEINLKNNFLEKSNFYDIYFKKIFTCGIIKT